MVGCVSAVRKQAAIHGVVRPDRLATSCPAARPAPDHVRLWSGQPPRRQVLIVMLFSLAEAVKQQAQLSLDVADLVLSIIDKLKHVTPAEDSAVAAAAAAPAAFARRTTRSAAAAAAQAGPSSAAAEDADHAEAYKSALKSLVVRGWCLSKPLVSETAARCVVLLHVRLPACQHVLGHGWLQGVNTS